MSVAELQKAAEGGVKALAEARETLVLENVGLRYVDDVRVRVQKPAWMPERLYRALMRTIIVEQRRRFPHVEPL